MYGFEMAFENVFSFVSSAGALLLIDFQFDRILSVYRCLVGPQHVRLTTTTKYGWKTETFFSSFSSFFSPFFSVPNSAREILAFYAFQFTYLYIYAARSQEVTNGVQQPMHWYYEHFSFFFGHWKSWAYFSVLFFRLFREIRFRSLNMSSFMSRTHSAHTHTHSRPLTCLVCISIWSNKHTEHV